MLEKLSENCSSDMTNWSSSDMSNWSAERFVRVLDNEFLQSKRYIIFVDDVWEKNTWEAINCVFPDRNIGSRVILTTRISEVSSEAHDVFRLKPLSPDKSRELFCKRIPRGDRDKELDKVSEKIIAKCGGVPLAIIAISSLLADRPLEDWQMVYDTIILGHEDNNTRTILLYSYYDLPPHLKPCVLYLSIYPEDRLIEKSRLIWKWIAEGFIQPKKERLSLFEAGETYFNELLNRSMIQPVQNNEDGSITGCHVHDIVLDLIRDLSAEENFVTIFDEKQCASSENVTAVHEVGHSGRERKVHRLSIQKCHEKLISHDTMSNQVAVRSVYIASGEVVKVMLSKFQACRVLAIEDSNNIRDSKHVSKLSHLRYLEINISHYDFELPKEIGNLKSLKTLILLGYLAQKPQIQLATICGLTQLKCLHIDPSIEVLPNTIGRLISLEELKLYTNHNPADCWVQFGKLTRLRVLEFRFSRYPHETCIKALVQPLSNLQEIKELHLRFYGERSTTATWDGWKPSPQLWRLNLHQVRFSPQLIDPSCFGRLRNLSVDNKVVEAKDLENLALLPELLYLYLQAGDCPSQRFIVGADGFKKLMVCEVPIELKFLQGAMPCLESLKFPAPFWCPILGYTNNEKGLVYRHLTVQINCILHKTQ